MNVITTGQTVQFREKMKTRSAIVCLVIILLANVTFAQDNQDSKSNDEIAKELANPNATLGTMAFPMDFTFYNGTLPEANKQFSTFINFQPSLPIPIANGVNLFARPLIPLIITQPVYGDDGFEQFGFNLGNISADVAVGKTWKSKTITIVGMFAGFPTATNENLRSSEITLGPEVMVAQLFKWGAIGLLVNHAWGVSGNPNENASSDEFSIQSNKPRHASVTAGQYFYVVNLKDAWQITGQPTWSYNHEAEEGSKLTFPIAAGVNKVISMGKLPVKISLQYWYYAASPEAFGPKHQIRLQFAPVVPLPW